MIRIIALMAVLGLGGCMSFSDQNPKMFYERKAELETQCKHVAHQQFPGYPMKRGVLTNYGFTRAYDQCLEKKVLN